MDSTTRPAWQCEGCQKISNAKTRPRKHARGREWCGPFRAVTIAPDGAVIASAGAKAAHEPTPYTSHGGPLRQSILRTFDSCPLSARFDVEGFRDYSTGPQAFGTVFHKIAQCILIELHGSQGADGRCEQRISTQEAVEIAREVMADPKMPHLSSAQMADMIGVVLRFCERKWTPENFMMLGREHERLSADIECPDGVTRTLTGLPDLVGANYPDGATIGDFKTGFGVPAAPRDRNMVVVCPKCQAPVGYKCVNGAGSEISSHPERAQVAAKRPVQGKQYLSDRGVFQLDSYGLLVMRNVPAVQWTKLFELHVRKNEVREAILTRDDLEHVEKHIGILLMRLDTALQEGAGSKLWEPREGSHCSYCPRPSACPIDHEERGKYAVTDEAIADEYARRYLRSDGLRDGYRTALQHYFNETGYGGRTSDGREIRFDGGRGGGAFAIVPVEDEQEVPA